MNHNADVVDDPRFDPSRVIQAPRGTTLSCKSWLTEAAYRMIQNNLDAEVAENPQRLVVYGGIGRAARNWACYDQILASLRELVPALPDDSLEPAPAGVRAQALRRDGSMVDDFAYVQAPRQIHVLNAPSPAATSTRCSSRAGGVSRPPR